MSRMNRGGSRVRGFPASPIRGMSRRVKVGLAAAAGVLVLLLPFCAVVVDQSESVFVTDFGRPVRLIGEPGLHGKWPWQTRRGLDRRLQLDTPPPREMLTKDKKTLVVAWYLSWKVADFGRFVRSVRAWPEASARLEDLASSVISARLVRVELSDLIKVGGVSGVETLMNDVTARVAEQAAKEYGLEVVDVRLRRLNYPAEVRLAVFEQIRSERGRVAAATRAEGESQARSIRSASDLEQSITLAEADAEAARVVGEGEAQAARINNDAYAADPTFYQFLKTLETYRVALDARTTLVLSTDSPFLRLLTQGVPDLTPPGPMAGPPVPTVTPHAAPGPAKPAAEVPTVADSAQPAVEPPPIPGPVKPPTAVPARTPGGAAASGATRSAANRSGSAATPPRRPAAGARP